MNFDEDYFEYLLGDRSFLTPEQKSALRERCEQAGWLDGQRRKKAMNVQEAEAAIRDILKSLEEDSQQLVESIEIRQDEITAVGDPVRRFIRNVRIWMTLPSSPGTWDGGR